MKKCAGIFLVVPLAACSFTQEPAPVVDGYGYSRPSVYGTARVQVENLQWEKGTDNREKQAVVTYTVQEGDTAHIIARRFKVPVENLVDANGLPNAEMLRIGQELTIPSQAEAPMPTGRYSLTRARFEKQEKAEESSLATAPRLIASHTVKKGETLYRIGQKYGVSAIDLMMYNKIDNPREVKIGTKLKVPPQGELPRAASASRGSHKPEKIIVQTAARAQGMVWPVSGRLLNRFGKDESGVNHLGLNIAVPENTPVLAAENGTVIYADDGLNSYGTLILVRHANGLVTAYAHTAKSLVKKGERVKKGQVIAYSGRSGNVDAPQLHFEVRRNARAIDPLTVLPN